MNKVIHRFPFSQTLDRIDTHDAETGAYMHSHLQPKTIVMKHTNINTGEAKMPQETDKERQDRTGLSSVSITDEESAAVQKTPHRISLDDILAKIEHEDYEHPNRHPHMTLCILTMTNGFIVIGKSTPADPKNYDQELGKKFAKEDAIRQIWPLEAYLLRERLSL